MPDQSPDTDELLRRAEDADEAAMGHSWTATVIACGTWLVCGSTHDWQLVLIHPTLYKRLSPKPW